MSPEHSLEVLIEQRLRTLEPDVEVLLVDRPRRGAVRLFIDAPQGVDLGLCERVSGHMGDLLPEHTLEVSSPGLDRPLTRPEHFTRFLGHEVRLRTHRALGGQRNFQGRLTAVDGEGISLDADGDPITIPHRDIDRSNLVPETFGGSR